MTTGAQRAETLPDDDGAAMGQDSWGTVPAAMDSADWSERDADETAPDRAGSYLLPGALILLAISWIGASAYAIATTGQPFTVSSLTPMIAVASGPLTLIGLLWLIFGQTPRRETDRFSRAVAAMRSESAALEAILRIVAERLEENHERLSSEATKLMALGEEAADRLGRVTHYLSKESATLDRKAEALENAAQAARVDIGVLLQDLPRAEEQARSLAGAMRETGLTAHEQAGALEGQLSVLVSRGREADEVVGGAAQRLAAHLAQIESVTANAAARMDEATSSMAAAIDTTMERAAAAVDATRAGIDQQGAALFAMIEQNRAALERAGEDAERSLAHRLEDIGSQIQGLASHLAAQDAASHALVSSLGKGLAEVEERFRQLDEQGAIGTGRLTNALQTVQACARELAQDLGAGAERSANLIDRAHEMAAALALVTDQLDGRMPEALARVEAQASQARSAALAIAPTIEAIEASAEGAAQRLSESEASAARQHEALEALLGIIRDGIGNAEERLKALIETIGEADTASARIISDTSPELVDALVRVRDTAHQAAEKAREAIGTVIPESAAALGKASRQALTEAVTAEVVGQMDELGRVAEGAVEAARKASERLTRQILSIGEAAAAVEARIDEAERERREKGSEGFTRRVALLIESLNSTAIDVTKILSNDVTDSAWNAYLKGDRGVFTRRAVRLLDAAEARQIIQHYEAEPEFRDQVNRYIHDFEAMLRSILGDRDGSTLGVTLLSSDMGKLYVALAQAIDRLRS